MTMSYNVALVYGSVQSSRQGIRAAYYLKKKLEERSIHVDLVYPLEYPLPLLNKMYKEYDTGQAPGKHGKAGEYIHQCQWLSYPKR